MAKVWISERLDFSVERVWTACNGATRRRLVVVNKLNLNTEGKTINCVEASLGYLDKGKHSFIFLNPPRPNDKRVLGLFLCSGYGYRVIEGDELYTASSVGGPGNSESRFGVYAPGTLIACASYKMRRGESFYRLDPENGWVYLGHDIPLSENEIQEI
ncbi:MAG: hypothetical protein GX971_07825 [Firmicutes bacterium]|nr:hypothetical protein [Bacillota bacterium]